MRAPRSYREALIFAVARAREKARKAQAEERRYHRVYGKCPDDQIIYAVYESQAELSTLRWALSAHRLMTRDGKPSKKS